MPTWPLSLPQSPLDENFRETTANNLLRTEMEQGPAKTRRRSTANVRKLVLSYLMSKTQVAALDAFIQATLSGGTLAFDFTHPRTGSTVSCRFRQMPEYVTVNGAFFKVGIELDVLP